MIDPAILEAALTDLRSQKASDIAGVDTLICLVKQENQAGNLCFKALEPEDYPIGLRVVL